MSNEHKMKVHIDHALKILSGGLSEGMNKRNYEERVDTALLASSLLVNKACEIYQNESDEQKP